MESTALLWIPAWMAVGAAATRVLHDRSPRARVAWAFALPAAAGAGSVALGWTAWYAAPLWLVPAALACWLGMLVPALVHRLPSGAHLRDRLAGLVARRESKAAAPRQLTFEEQRQTRIDRMDELLGRR